MYPYGETPIRLLWDDRKAWMFAGMSIIFLVAYAWMNWPISLIVIDEWMLHALFPAALATTLAFAPRPGTRVSLVAKDLTVIAILISIISGDYVLVMIVCYPVLLAVSVFMGETRWAAMIWNMRS